MQCCYCQEALCVLSGNYNQAMLETATTFFVPGLSVLQCSKAKSYKCMLRARPARCFPLYKPLLISASLLETSTWRPLLTSAFHMELGWAQKRGCRQCCSCPMNGRLLSLNLGNISVSRLLSITKQPPQTSVPMPFFTVNPTLKLKEQQTSQGTGVHLNHQPRTLLSLSLSFSKLIKRVIMILCKTPHSSEWANYILPPFWRSS